MDAARHSHITTTGATHGRETGSDTLLRRTLYLNQPTLNQFAVDTQGQAKFRIGAVGHTLLAGFDYQNNEITGRTGVGGFAAPINVFHTVYGNYQAPTSTRDLMPAK